MAKLTRAVFRSSWISSFIILSALIPQIAAAGSAIFYQGELRSGGAPVTGWYDFEFRLYDVPEGGKPIATVQRAAQTYVQNGTFTLFLDFGDIPDGVTGYLEVSVRSDGSADPYTVLSPRQVVGAVTTSGLGIESTAGESWRLGVTVENEAAYSAVIGRPAGESGAFRSDRDTRDIRFMFPAAATEKTIRAAQFYLIQRSGVYADSATLSLETYDMNGTLQHQASSAVDVKTAATGTWTAFTLSGSGDDLVVSPGEYLCVHFALGGDPGGDLDVRPMFEVEVE